MSKTGAPLMVTALPVAEASSQFPSAAPPDARNHRRKARPPTSQSGTRATEVGGERSRASRARTHASHPPRRSALRESRRTSRTTWDRRPNLATPRARNRKCRPTSRFSLAVGRRPSSRSSPASSQRSRCKAPLPRHAPVAPRGRRKAPARSSTPSFRGRAEPNHPRQARRPTTRSARQARRAEGRYSRSRDPWSGESSLS